MAKKPKERYTKACQKYNKYPLSCVLQAFEKTSIELARNKIGPEHTKALVIALLVSLYSYYLYLKKSTVNELADRFSILSLPPAESMCMSRILFATVQ